MCLVVCYRVERRTVRANFTQRKVLVAHCFWVDSTAESADGSAEHVVYSTERPWLNLDPLVAINMVALDTVGYSYSKWEGPVEGVLLVKWIVPWLDAFVFRSIVRLTKMPVRRK